MRIASVEVGTGAVEALVAFELGEPLRTTGVPGCPERLLGLLPGLKGHRCDNDAGLTFADELADTELAHVLEHAALEIAALAGSPHTLKGRTAWDFARDGRGVFRVAIEYDDDLVALGALRAAEDVVRWLIAGGEAPDVQCEAVRLRGLRRR